MCRFCPTEAGWQQAATSAVVCLLLLVGAGGCGQYASVELTQPHRTGKRSFQLQSEQAEFATGSDRTDRLLLAWPLPGALAGRPEYTLYLRVPGGGGTFEVGERADDGGGVAGFLTQQAGRLAGLTWVKAGSVTVGGGAESRHGRLQLRCEDGTEVVGRFRAARADLAVEFFEDNRAADLARMTTAVEKPGS